MLNYNGFLKAKQNGIIYNAECMDEWCLLSAVCFANGFQQSTGDSMKNKNV